MAYDMDYSSPPRLLELVVETRGELDAILDTAVERLMPAAMAEAAGIQITRSGVGTYTASVRQDIPFGTTVESWALR